MDISIVLAKFFALYFVVVGVAMIINRAGFMNDLKLMLKDRPVLFFSALFTLIFGALLVSVHNIWVSDWRLFITLLSWYIFIKGAVRVLFPLVDEKWAGLVENKTFYNVSGAIVIVLGIYLGYLGFMN